MHDVLEQFIDWSRSHGWQVDATDGPDVALPPVIASRYRVPDEYVRFLSRVRVAVNQGRTKWLLCVSDFDAKPEDEFRWNEYEIISLDAADADHDEKWAATIRGFWDNHLPFCMSVDDMYEYYAFDLANGTIVQGCEPEFEDTTPVANSFDEFLAKVMSGELL